MSIINKFLMPEANKSSNNGKKLWNYMVFKGFAIDPLWLAPLLASIAHVFIDMRFVPYGFNIYPLNVKVILSVTYAIVMGGGFYLGIKLISRGSAKWEIWKETLWLIVVLFLITNTNYLLRLFILFFIFDIGHLYPITYFRFLLVGAEVAGISALVFEFFQFVLIKAGVDISLKKSRVKDTVAKDLLQITGKGKKEQLFLCPSTFVYAQSSGNYLDVFIYNSETGKLDNAVLRLSLQNFLLQLKGFDEIVRVHKSFVFNLKHKYIITGNSRSASLKIVDYNVEIPVSRVFYKEHLKNS